MRVFYSWRSFVVANSWLNRFRKNVRPMSRPIRTKNPQGRFLPMVESLDERVTPAVTGTFPAAGGQLKGIGGGLGNSLGGSRGAAGAVFVNGGATPGHGG